MQDPHVDLLSSGLEAQSALENAVSCTGIADDAS